jgi:hypothetical protein
MRNASASGFGHTERIGEGSRGSASHQPQIFGESMINKVLSIDQLVASGPKIHLSGANFPQDRRDQEFRRSLSRSRAAI